MTEGKKDWETRYDNVKPNEKCLANDCEQCHGLGVINAFVDIDSKPFTCPS